MANKDITQKVIDFEFSRIHMKDEGQHHVFDQKSQIKRFSQWNLNNIIHALGLTQQNQYIIKWVGFDQTSYIDAFIYCLFQGCRNAHAAKNGVFIKLKYNIYQLSAKFLKINDQKLIVQTLCSAQYAKNLITFLNRSKILQILFQKLIKCYVENQKDQFLSEIQDLRIFAKTFSFLKFQVLNECIGLIQHVNQRFYIINEKGCYFIIEVEPQKHKIMELKKIVQNEHDQEQYIHQKTIKPNLHQEQELQLKNQKNQEEQPKKKYQYAAPQFILKNGTHKKHKKQPRFTEVQVQEDFLSQFRKVNDNNKTKTVDPSLVSRNCHLISQQKPSKFEDFRKSFNRRAYNHQNPEAQSKSHSKQKSKKRRIDPKDKFIRGKTGFIQLTPQMRNLLCRNQTNSKPKSNHDITFDDKQIKKGGKKIIQLTLKNIRKSKSKNKDKNTHSCNSVSPVHHYSSENHNNHNHHYSHPYINGNINLQTHSHTKIPSIQHIHQTQPAIIKSLTPTNSSIRNSLRLAFPVYNGY